MPWTVDNPPNPAKNKSKKEKQACVTAANMHIKNHPGDDEGAIHACLAAMSNAKKSKGEDEEMSMHLKSIGGDRVLLEPVKQEKATAGITFSDRYKELCSFFEGQNVHVLAGTAGKVTNLSEVATLHNLPENFEVVKSDAQNEFGIVIEDPWGAFYVGPFADEASATKKAEDMVDREWTPVGTQIFLVKDVAMWRKKHKDS